MLALDPAHMSGISYSDNNTVMGMHVNQHSKLGRRNAVTTPSVSNDITGHAGCDGERGGMVGADLLVEEMVQSIS